MISTRTLCVMPSKSFLCWTVWRTWERSQTSDSLLTGMFYIIEHDSGESGACTVCVVYTFDVGVNNLVPKVSYSGHHLYACVKTFGDSIFMCVCSSGTLRLVPSRGRWFSMLVLLTVVKPTTPSSATWLPSLESTVAPWSYWLTRSLRRATLPYVLWSISYLKLHFDPQFYSIREKVVYLLLTPEGAVWNLINCPKRGIRISGRTVQVI